MSYTPKIYLAGAIQNADDNGHGWRDEITETYDEIDWINPLDEYEAPADEYGSWDDEFIMQNDRRLIDSADGLLLHYERVPSYGTPREHEYAVANDKPVFVRTAVRQPSPWVTADAEVVCTFFETAVEAIHSYEWTQ